MRYDDVRGILNGFITLKEESKIETRAACTCTEQESANNLLLKENENRTIFNSEDVLDILDSVGVTVTKGELGALLRKKGHKITKECGDRYARISLRD